jgi:hypothetical protein
MVMGKEARKLRAWKPTEQVSLSCKSVCKVNSVYSYIQSFCLNELAQGTLGRLCLSIAILSGNISGRVLSNHRCWKGYLWLACFRGFNVKTLVPLWSQILLRTFVASEVLRAHKEVATLELRMCKGLRVDWAVSKCASSALSWGNACPHLLKLLLTSCITNVAILLILNLTFCLASSKYKACSLGEIKTSKT